MTLIPPAGRKAAADCAEQFEIIQIAAGLCSVVGGAAATASGLAALTVSGPCGLLAVLFGVLRWKAHRMADDPADPSYAEPATPEWIVFDDTWVDTEPWTLPDVAGMAEMIGMLNGAQALLGATVTAFERAQGAYQAGARGYVPLRAAEARMYAREAARQLEALSDQLTELAVSLSEERWVPALSEAEPNARWPTELAGLDGELGAFFYRSGIPLSTIKAGLQRQREHTTVPLVDSLVGAKASIDTLVQFLRRWQPRETRLLDDLSRGPTREREDDA